MNSFKTFGIAAATVGALTMTSLPTIAQDMSRGAANFYQSESVTAKKVIFKNQYDMKVAGNLYRPKDYKAGTKLPAIIVGHPMGAVKEQSSNLYAQKLAEKGFVTLAIDLSFWGESEGNDGSTRHLVSPEIYSDDFSAALDYLSTQKFVDTDNIGVLGICGSGSFAISAAKIDPRMKAIATVSMYDMGSAFRNGLNKSQTLEQRKAIIAQAAEQRLVEFEGGKPKFVGGTDTELTEQTNPIQREFFDFYRTSRGAFTPKGDKAEQTTKPSLSSMSKFANFYPFNDIETISPRPMLFITGDSAHSIEFSKDAYKRASEPKELVIVPNAGHVDMYDRADVIPWDKLGGFFKKNLK